MNTQSNPEALPPTTGSGSFALDPWLIGPRITMQSTSDGEAATPFECIGIESISGASIILISTDQMTEQEAEHTASLVVAAPKLLVALENLLHETSRVRLSSAVEKQVCDAIAEARLSMPNQ